MARIKAKPFSKSEDNNPKIQEIKKAIKKNKDKRMHVRYIVIYHHLQGYLNKDIANMESLCEHTVGTYVNNYKSNGIDGLRMNKSSGAPRFLTKEQEELLVDTITEHTPDEVGFAPRKNWDSNIICQWVYANFKVHYSRSGMLDALHRLNLSYTRPTYTLNKANPEKQEEFKKDFEDLKKTN